MNSCANSCRAPAAPARLTLLVAASGLALAGLGCGPESGASDDQRAYSVCLAELEQTYGGARYDSALILACSEEQCGGPAQGAVSSLLDVNGHALRRSLSSLSMLVVDVGSREEVLPWACRYMLDPAYAGAFGEAFPNLALDLR